MSTFNAHIAYRVLVSLLQKCAHFICHNALLHWGYMYTSWALHPNGFSLERPCARVCVFVHALSIRVYKINRIIVRHIYFLCNIRPFARKWYQITTTPPPTDEIKRSPRMHKNHKGRLIRVWPVNCALLATSTASSVQNLPVCTNEPTSTHHIYTITRTHFTQNKRRSRSRNSRYVRL